MKFTKAAIVVPLLPVLLAAQGADIRGVVSDSTTGERMPYVNVVISGTTRGASSNQSGFYLIPKLPLGSYEIVASAIGYDAQAKRIVVEGLGPIIVNFRLVVQAVKMHEVVVSGRAKPELTEIYTSAHVLEKTDLKRVPIAGQEDVFRSIQVLPGIVSTSDVNAQFYVRGGAADQNLILLDGMKVHNPFHAFGLFSIFDPDILRSAEVYTGAFPADFGGRLSSVVNILSRDGNASSIAGRVNANFLSSKIQLEGPLSRSLQVIATGRKSLFSQTFKRFLKESAPLSFYDALVKVTYKDYESPDRLSAQMFVSGDDLKFPNENEPDYSWTNRAFAVELNKLFQDRLFVNVVLSGGNFEQVRDAKASESTTPASTSVQEVSLRVNATAYMESKSLYVFGFELNFPSLEYNFTNRFGEKKTLSSSFPDGSSWIRYQTTLGIVQVDGGLRVELGSLFRGRSFQTGFQPRLNLAVGVGSGWKAKVAYGRFSQEAVTVNNEDDLIPIFNAWIVVPDNLQAERADHFVVSFDGNLFPSLSTSVEGFYKNYHSLLSYNRDKVDPGDPDYVNARAASYGAEALVRFAHPILDFYLSYSLAFVKLDLNGFAYPPRYDRRHALNVLSSIHIAEDVNLSLRWEYGSGLPFTQNIGFYDRLTLGSVYPNGFFNETGMPYSLLGPKNGSRLPAYHRLDISLSYSTYLTKSFRSSIGLNIINAYGHKNVFYFDRNTGQQVSMLGFFPSASLLVEFVP
jgi:hypothetical protein